MARWVLIYEGRRNGSELSKGLLQAALFEPCNKEKQNAAMIALDKINWDYGRNTVKVAAMGQKREYKARAQHLSRCYTTRLEDVVQIWKL